MTAGYKSNTPVEHKDTWQTSPELFAALDSEFEFALDAAASAENALCENFITEEQDTLIMAWELMADSYVWLNPPYSKIMPFVQKAAREALDNFIGCVMLVPADTSVGWFKEATKTASEVRFITGGRLSFVSSDSGKAVGGNNKGSMLIIWHPWPYIRCQLSMIDRDALMTFGGREIEKRLVA
jgi:phage N-6-adenine-methyltransferase